MPDLFTQAGTWWQAGPGAWGKPQGEWRWGPKQAPDLRPLMSESDSSLLVAGEGLRVHPSQSLLPQTRTSPCMVGCSEQEGVCCTAHPAALSWATSVSFVVQAYQTQDTRPGYWVPVLIDLPGPACPSRGMAVGFLY